LDKILDKKAISVPSRHSKLHAEIQFLTAKEEASQGTLRFTYVTFMLTYISQLKSQ